MSELNINPGIEIKNSRLEIYHFRVRLAIASGFVSFMFLLLFVRFAYLQVVQYQHYSTLAEANRISIVPIVPNRGIIVDRNGVLLAHNYSAYTLEIMPSKVESIDTLIDELATVVEISPRDRRRFKKLLEESKSFDSLPIRTRLSDEEIARFAANRYRFRGVEINARLFRQYPQSFPQDKTPHTACARAQRHTDSHFLLSLTYRKRHHAVDANRRQQKRQAGKNR